MKAAAITAGLAFLVAAGAVYAVHERHKVRPGPEIVDRARADLERVQEEMRILSGLRDLPMLEGVWTDVRFLLESCGLEVRPVTDAEAQADGAHFFSGPVSSWHATVTGRPISTLACLDAVNNLHSVWIGRFALEAGSASANISVLGRVQ